MNFDPFESVVEPYHKKKKRAMKGKSCNKSVVMMDKGDWKVPRGDKRKSMERKGQVQMVKMDRSMDASEIKEAILDKFKWVHSYTVLTSNQSAKTGSGQLVRATEQHPDGNEVVDRRGYLYLRIEECDDFIPQSDSSDSDFEGTSRSAVKRKIKKAKKVLAKLRTPGPVDRSNNTPKSSSDDSSQEDKHKKEPRFDRLESRRIQEEQDRVLAESLAIDQEKAYKVEREKKSKFDLVESRRIREEQDHAFAESLAIDKANDQAKAYKVEREKLKQTLSTKWSEAMKTKHVPGVKFTLWYPDATKVDCCIPLSILSSEVIYELAYAFGPTVGSFLVYSRMPRILVHHDDHSLERANINFPTVLVVEQADDAPNPVQLFASIESHCPIEPNTTTNLNEPQPFTADQLLSDAGHMMASHGMKIIQEVDSKREGFMMDILDTHHGLPRVVRREYLYEDCIDMYREKILDILEEFPFRIHYKNEKAIDTGGVSRDFFSAFWEIAYEKHFDGDRLLVPSNHADSDLTMLPFIGTVLSHGFMSCGYLPVRIAFPTVALSLLGPTTSIPEDIVVESFGEYISSYENNFLRQAIAIANRNESFPASLESHIIDIFARFDARQLPTPNNIQSLTVQVSKHVLISKQMGAIYAVGSGVPVPYHAFFKDMSVETLFQLYKALNATPSGVLQMIVEPDDMNAMESRIFHYLLSFVRNLSPENSCSFLRFVTGSSVMSNKEIKVTFNHLTGLARRPISHTCDCILELSTSYASFPDLNKEFLQLLSSDGSLLCGEAFVWKMDAV